MITLRFPTGVVVEYAEADSVTANAYGSYLVAKDGAGVKQIAFVPHGTGAIVEFGVQSVRVVERDVVKTPEQRGGGKAADAI